MHGFFCLVAISFLLTGCGYLFPKPVNSDEFASGQPALTGGDFPDATPCSDRDTLPNDETFLSTITKATQVIHVHKEYTDDSKLPAVCGIAAEDNTLQEGETGWDPSLGVNVYACNSFDESLPTFLVSTGYDPGICRCNFGYNKTDNTTEGFPRGGHYRVDVCISDDEKSYDVRLRFTISGSDANKTWTSADIGEDTSLEIFNSAGFQLSTIEDAKELKELITNDPWGTDFTIRSQQGTITHLFVALQVICVKSQESCPTPDPACD